MLKKKSKFTLIEMLVVIVIISILATLVYPAYSDHSERASITQAKSDMANLIIALSSYKTEYGGFDLLEGNVTGVASGATSADFTVSWNDMKETLIGTDTDTNPRQIKFLTEDFDSPWYTAATYAGFDYRIVLDGNEDGEINFTEGTPSENNIKADAISYVKNNNLRTTDNDVRSWE